MYYRVYLPEQSRFGATVKVSSQAFNLQTVAISRAAMAVDGAGRLHVMWYVAEEGQYFYARSNLEEPNLSLSALWLQLSGKGLMPVVMWLRWALLSPLYGGRELSVARQSARWLPGFQRMVVPVLAKNLELATRSWGPVLVVPWLLSF